MILSPAVRGDGSRVSSLLDQELAEEQDPGQESGPLAPLAIEDNIVLEEPTREEPTRKRSCNFFWTKKGCRNGDRCRYSHRESDRSSGSRPKAGSRTASSSGLPTAPWTGARAAPKTPLMPPRGRPPIAKAAPGRGSARTKKRKAQRLTQQ